MWIYCIGRSSRNKIWVNLGMGRSTHVLAQGAVVQMVIVSPQDTFVARACCQFPHTTLNSFQAFFATYRGKGFLLVTDLLAHDSRSLYIRRRWSWRQKALIVSQSHLRGPLWTQLAHLVT